MALIFDLDQTIIDSSIAEPYRKVRDWPTVYSVINRFVLYPGVIDALRNFKNSGLRICIVTSSPSSYCNKVLKYWDIPSDHMVCYHDTKNKKPHPEPINRALSLLRIPAEKAISFGDCDIDIIASNNANVRSVACTWGASNITTLIKSNPTYTVKNSEELISLVQRLNFCIA